MSYEQTLLAYDRCAILLCGMKGMAEAVKALATDAGVPPEKVGYTCTLRARASLLSPSFQQSRHSLHCLLVRTYH